MRHRQKLKGKTYVSYGLHETFYDRENKENGYTRDSIIGHFENRKEMVAALEMMLKDAKKDRPIINYKG